MVAVEFLIALVVLIALVTAVALGFLPGSVPSNKLDLPPTNIPDGSQRWEPQDVTSLRFEVVTRGYRMEQVDEALIAVAEQLRRRDDEIERLIAEQSTSGDLPGDGTADQSKLGDPKVTNGSLPSNTVTPRGDVADTTGTDGSETATRLPPSSTLDDDNT